MDLVSDEVTQKWRRIGKAAERGNFVKREKLITTTAVCPIFVLHDKITK